MPKATSIYQLFVGVLIFAFPLFFLVLDHWGSSIAALLLLLAFLNPVFKRNRDLSQSEKHVLLVVLFFIMSLLLTYLLVDQGECNISGIKRYG